MMINRKYLPMPTADRVRELFDYRDGQLYWRERSIAHFHCEGDRKRWNSRFAGTLAGCLKPNGYRSIKVDGRLYQASRLILRYHDQDPDALHAYHLNGNPEDNRIENLRIVTQAENVKNRKRYINNVSGVTGVHWSQAGQKWYVHGRVDKESVFLGCFDTLLDAAARRYRHNREQGYEERHGK